MHVLQAGRCRAGIQHNSLTIGIQHTFSCSQARGTPVWHPVHRHQHRQSAVSSKHQNADVVSSGAVQRQSGQNSPSKPDYEEDRELHR